MYNEFDQDFRAFFGLSLRDYWKPLTGFDVVKFDKFIKPEDDQTTKDAVVVKYGTHAAEFLDRLVSFSPLSNLLKLSKQAEIEESPEN